jgi:hypothetical protein
MIRILILFLLFPFASVAQSKVKKKYYGTYQGIIPSYQIDTGNDLLPIDSTAIEIQIEKGFITLKIGSQTITGTYKTSYSTEESVIIEAKMADQIVSEKIHIYTKQKKIMRIGIYPQPDAILEKI